MTVKELIEELNQFDEDQEVFVSHPSYDFWNTILAQEVDTIETGQITWSEYHRTNKLLEDYSPEDYDDDEVKTVVIIS